MRLIGIDTPESVAPDRPVECFAHEAAAKAAELLAGQTVFLEEDLSQDNRSGARCAILSTSITRQ